MGIIKEDNRAYIRLEESEAIVAHIASRIFSEHFLKAMNDKNAEDSAIEESIRLAIKLVKKTDAMIKADEEI